MKVSSMLVISVTMKLQKSIVWQDMFNLYMKVSSMIVISVTTKQHNRVILKFIFNLNMKESGIVVIYVTSIFQTRVHWPNISNLYIMVPCSLVINKCILWLVSKLWSLAKIPYQSTEYLLVVTTGCSSVILERCPGRSYAASIKIGLIVRTRPFLHFFTSFMFRGGWSWSWRFWPHLSKCWSCTVHAFIVSLLLSEPEMFLCPRCPRVEAPLSVAGVHTLEMYRCWFMIFTLFFSPRSRVLNTRFPEKWRGVQIVFVLRPVSCKKSAFTSSENSRVECSLNCRRRELEA